MKHPTILCAVSLIAALQSPVLGQLQKPGQATLRAKQALQAALAPSEAELSTRVTPVVRAVRATADSVVSILIHNPQLRGQDVEGQGSGVIIDEKGLVLTNWHVVLTALGDSGRVIQVRLKNGKSYAGEVLSTSPEFDLALIQLKLPANTAVQPVTMGDSDSLMIGETVIAIGNPKGHANTVTVGVLSAINRSITVQTPDRRLRQYKGLLQTDAAINQGNSGGALLDITGKLVGINNAMSVNSENIGFAIPVNTVRRVFHQVLLSSENLTRVYLGMQVLANGSSIRLTNVTANGPAHRAGLRDGDELVRVGESTVQSTLDYARSILGARSGQAIDMTVRRGSRELTLRPVPMSNAAWAVVRRVGLEFETVTAAQDRRLVETATRDLYRELRQTPRRLLPGVLRVTRVHKGSTGEALGVRPGDVLLGIVDQIPDFFGARQVVNTYSDIRELNDSLHVMAQRGVSREFTVWILRNGEVLDGALEVPRI
ncbi:MAG: trypsin-like peptidase domain-containing protein [Planctomycetes bacterium]|nr:trypsin-like peptidase domain-containing protein [Planctomycetota bacterium]MCB9871367.1 trypsin-like peptidase domain-containing protein [Planctomycetota bacterium]MCB9888621.1 trypsin-like peptidase domain-containing protein [Planctomycetota bacterium]